MMREKKKTVLIVDDDEGSREFVKAIMSNEGWETLEGVTGYDALILAAEHHPNLIILDVMMPEMDGFEAFRRLRSDPLTHRIPVVMLTAINELDMDGGHNEQSMEQRLGVERPEGFVDKPVDSMFLLDTIFGIVRDGGV